MVKTVVTTRSQHSPCRSSDEEICTIFSHLRKENAAQNFKLLCALRHVMAENGVREWLYSVKIDGKIQKVVLLNTETATSSQLSYLRPSGLFSSTKISYGSSSITVTNAFIAMESILSTNFCPPENYTKDCFNAMGRLSFSNIRVQQYATCGIAVTEALHIHTFFVAAVPYCRKIHR